MPEDAEAGRRIQKVWDATLRTCAGSAFELLGQRVVIELDTPRFHLAPTVLGEAAKERGYQYQVTAVASARRWRWAPFSPGDRPLKWTDWQEGQNIVVRHDEFGIQREHTLVEDAVLQFDLVRKDGVWKANHPLSPLNSDIHDFDLESGAMPDQMPSCDRLSAGR